MAFSLDFFRDEIRTGFYIPTALKQAWAAELDILALIDSICTRHNINYFAEWGTMLGAIRHGGIIPWDDDIDIGMMRSDYIKFRKVCDAHLPDGYVIHDYERKEDHWLFLSRIVSCEHINFDEKYLNEHYNFPWLASVDIFVTDYVYEDPEREKVRRDEIMRLLAFSESIIDNKIDDYSLNEGLKAFEDKYHKPFTSIKDRRSICIELYRTCEELMSLLTSDDSGKVGQIFPWILKGVPPTDASNYSSFVRLPFEHTTIPVPCNYVNTMSYRFGQFLNINKSQGGHGYPFFEEQKKDFEALYGEKLFNFSFKKSMIDTPRTPKISHAPGENENVLFLPIGPKEWNYFKKCFDMECARENVNIFIIPLPLLKKDLLGQINMSDDEIMNATHSELYPEDLPIISWLEFDPNQYYMDRIYIQSPYDDTGTYLTLPPSFYAKTLQQCTDQLIYVPLGPIDDFEKEYEKEYYNLNHYIKVPAAVYSDTIIACSKKIRQVFIDKLTEFAGDKSASYWENKVITYPDTTAFDSSCDNENKSILYCIGLNELSEKSDVLIDAVSKRLDTISEYADTIDISVCLYPNDLSLWNSANANLTADLTDILSKHDGIAFIAPAGGHADPDFYMHPLCEEVDDCAKRFDAYYGSPTPYAMAFTLQHKPVMIADYNI